MCVYECVYMSMCVYDCVCVLECVCVQVSMHVCDDACRGQKLTQVTSLYVEAEFLTDPGGT